MSKLVKIAQKLQSRMKKEWNKFRHFSLFSKSRSLSRTESIEKATEEINYANLPYFDAIYIRYVK